MYVTSVCVCVTSEYFFDEFMLQLMSDVTFLVFWFGANQVRRVIHVKM